MKLIKKLSIVFLLIFSSSIWSADVFLSPEQAFDAKWIEKKDVLEVQVQIAEGYYLYKSSISAKFNDGTNIPNLLLPAPTIVYDNIFNKNLEVYPNSLTFKLPLSLDDNRPSSIELTYQGCAKEGLCYPPEVKVIRLGANSANSIQFNSSVIDANNFLPGKEQVSNLSFVQEILKSQVLWKVILSFITFGVLLSFTPCVLPMIPILSSIIIGKSSDLNDQSKKTKPIFMALSYSAGMITIYTVMGVLAGLLGESLSIYLQQPAVLGVFALMLLVFGLSMLDIVKFEMPGSLQNRLLVISSKIPGGNVISVYVMGAISSLIVGPCVAGPLAGTLIYISQTSDVLIGGIALFSMALGMSLPLVLTGISADRFLPRVGPWMIQIKTLFAFILFAMALWMVNSILPKYVLMFLIGFYAILVATYLGIFEKLSNESDFSKKISKIAAVLFFFIGISQWIGVAAGNGDFFRPLSNTFGNSKGLEIAQKELNTVSTVSDLNRAIQLSKKPVVLDFYADWCVSCKELELTTFSDERVKNEMKNFEKIKVDVTQINSESKILLKKYALFGPPAILFLNSDGSSIESKKIVGYVEPGKLTNLLQDAKR